MKMFACKFAQDEVTHQRLRVGSKKHVLSLPEGSVQPCPEAARREGRSHFFRAERTRNTGARKNGENAADGFFQQTQ
jgi:hypothetical protein